MYSTRAEAHMAIIESTSLQLQATLTYLKKIKGSQEQWIDILFNKNQMEKNRLTSRGRSASVCLYIPSFPSSFYSFLDYNKF